MDAWMWIVLAAIVVLVVVVAALIARRRRRRTRLQSTFGSEYDRTVDDVGKRRRAEAQLSDRVEQRERLDIRPLSDAARERYGEEWTAMQLRFVDRPEAAVVDADGLVSQVMRERGYPVEDFEQQSDLVSVDHPDIVEHYRDAHGIYERQRGGTASTEDLRRAVISYRVLFDELLRDGQTHAAEQRR
jgi:hypothetical protein